ncbi:MAG: hypothetical protein ACREFA_06970, partial [Stellaceae bacterium]
LGGVRERVEAYASGGFYQEGKVIDALAAEAEGYRARGFRGMKMKIGRNPATQTPLRHLVEGAEVWSSNRRRISPASRRCGAHSDQRPS